MFEIGKQNRKNNSFFPPIIYEFSLSSMTFPVNLRIAPCFSPLLISNSLSRKFRTRYLHTERNDAIARRRRPFYHASTEPQNHFHSATIEGVNAATLP